MIQAETGRWDNSQRAETGEDVTASLNAALNAALEAGDLSRIMATLGEMARSHRMARVAQETGLGRESLYKSLAATGRPEFATVLKVARALGFRLQAVPISGEDVR